MFMLLAILLTEGFISISIEILAIRQMIPYVGNSVIVTSIIIGIFLLFLALGYRRGGSCNADYQNILLNNFTKASVGIAIGMSPLFIYLFFFLMEQYVSRWLPLNLTLYLLLVTAPIIYILGQTLPITTNLFRQERNIGAISGKALYISTIGSFLGAVLTTLILFNVIGVGATVFFNLCLLAALVLLLQYNRQPNYYRITTIGFILLVAFALNINAEQLMFVHSNNYANYMVSDHYQDKKGVPGKALIINNSLSSLLKENGQAAAYIETIKKILFDDLNLKNQQILVLGAGGFTLTADGNHHNQVTYVDIDPDIYSVVKKHFLPNIHGQFVAADAYQYVQQHPARYDVIVADTYSNRNTIPSHLLTVEYINHIYKALNDNGLAIFNIIANPMFSDTFSIRIDNTISSVFTKCMKQPLQYWNKKTNIIYLCRKHKNKLDNMVYTHDLNRATLNSFFAKP